jgi:hypothetical protein
MLKAEQIDEVRRICRLESLRSAVLSVASESLDHNTPRLDVSVSLEADELVAVFSYSDGHGHVIAGGNL